MSAQTTFTSIDEYLAPFPEPTRRILDEIRSLVHEIMPEIAERISYGMPTFSLEGRYLVYVAGWKKHISIYPSTPGVEATLGPKLDPYRSGKGTLQFPVNKPMPMDLIRRIIEVRAEEVRAERSAGRNG